MKGRTQLILRLLRNAPLILFALTFLVFGLLSERFLQLDTLVNIVRQASYIGVIAVGMIFVILTGGIDLSVGSVMYLSAVIAGIWVLGPGGPIWLAVLVIAVVGAVAGLLNALWITRFKIAPFIVTLGTQAIFKGVGLGISQSQGINFPPEILAIGSTDLFGIPSPIVIFLGIALAAHLVLRFTPFGRQVYAVGEDLGAAKKAGLADTRILTLAYLISGLLAAIGGLVLVGQFGNVNAGFGNNKEFDAIAAAVLGGASLFGGRGNIFPGTVLGTVLVQMVTAGLIFTQVDLYLQPLVFGGIIFLAVMLDSLRTTLIVRLERRTIRQARVLSKETVEPEKEPL
jgi:ribose/xylose/arabinose/galactoside ABC-type transport system permease subunit